MELPCIDRKVYLDMGRVFIHGLGQTPDSWHATLSYMEEKEYVCLDLMECVHNQKVSYGNLYKAFSKLCDKMDGPIDLCGLSLGGVLALNYAIEKPEKVKTLVLIAAPYKMPKMLLKLQNICFRFMPESMFQQMGFERREYIDLCKSMMELDFSEQLDQIACPVMIICGEKDRANGKACKKLAMILNNARMEIISGAGHEVNVEAPDQLGRLLKQFWF